MHKLLFQSLFDVIRTRIWYGSQLVVDIYALSVKPVNPKGNQSWIFIGRTDVETETPILWPPDAKIWLILKDPDAEKEWGQEEKGTTKDEMVDGITDLMDMGLGGLWESVIDR